VCFGSTFANLPAVAVGEVLSQDSTYLTPDGRIWFQLPQDLSLPIKTKLTPVPADAIAQNRALFSLRELRGQRVLVRLTCDVMVTYKGTQHYKRLRGCALTLSCPNGAQAELAIKAILNFGASLDGKWLCE
jgi:hypothetical protein